MRKDRFDAMFYELMRTMQLHSAEARLSGAKMTPAGLQVAFDGGPSAVIALADLRTPGSGDVVALVDWSPVAATMMTASGVRMVLGADTLRQLAEPGGRAMLDSDMRNNQFVVGSALRLLRSNLAMSIGTLAQRTGMSAADLAAIEAGRFVSEWDLNLIGAALDAFVSDILMIEERLAGPLQHRYV